MTTEEKLDLIIRLRDEVIKEAEDHYATTKQDCPLSRRGDHDELSQMISGCGKWKWTCPFCGETVYE